MSVSNCTSICSSESLSDPVRRESSSVRVPVLQLARFFEASCREADPPPRLQRGRFSRMNSEKILNKRVLKEKDAPSMSASITASEGLPRVNPIQLDSRLQLDLNRVIEKTEKRFKLERSRSASMISFSKVTCIQSARELRTPSFAEIAFCPQTARSYLPDSLNRKIKLDLSEFPDLKHKVAVFEKAVLKYLRSCFKAENLSKVNGRVIEDEVQRLCRAEVDGMFQKSNKPLSADLQITESPRAKSLIRMVQKSGVILLPVIERLQIYRGALIEYIELRKCVSPNMRVLAQALDDLVVMEHYVSGEDHLGLVSGKEIKNFVEAWDRFCALKTMKPFVKLVEQAFGDTRRIRKEVMATLRKWMNPPPEIFILLKKDVHRMDWDNIAAMNIPYFVHEWWEAAQSENPISGIAPHEIMRCMHTGVGVPMKKLTVNHTVFYDDAMEEDGPIPSEKEFLFALVKRLYQAGLDPDVGADEIRRQVDCLLKWKGLRLEEQEKAVSAHPFPCMKVLRLLTNSAWGHGDSYLRNLFPTLFSLPYWTKAIQSLEYDVTIKDASHFTVKMNRIYATYLRLVPDNPDSYAVDRMKPLVEFNFSWSLSPEDESWKGVLCVENYEIKPKAGEHKWPILRSVIHYDEKESLDGLQNDPGTPRMRSAPRISLQHSDRHEKLTPASSSMLESLPESSSSSSKEGLKV
jgi:hypothetical protein